jgi:XTP/dITP diphosphohydrolase
MKDILIATRNPGKLHEIRDFLKDLPCKIEGLSGSGIEGDCEETGQTYQENAVLKARYFYEKTVGNVLVLADDLGIVVEALADELGVQTRRWGAGHEASDQEWLDFFLKRLSTETNRKAKFICSVALYDGTDMKVFEGEVPGMIVEKVEAPLIPGVPLSSVFRPYDQKKVFSMMTTEEKSKFSHRGKAMAKVVDYLSS